MNKWPFSCQLRGCWITSHLVLKPTLTRSRLKTLRSSSPFHLMGQQEKLHRQTINRKWFISCQMTNGSTDYLRARRNTSTHGPSPRMPSSTSSAPHPQQTHLTSPEPWCIINVLALVYGQWCCYGENPPLNCTSTEPISSTDSRDSSLQPGRRLSPTTLNENTPESLFLKEDTISVFIFAVIHRNCVVSKMWRDKDKCQFVTSWFLVFSEWGFKRGEKRSSFFHRNNWQILYQLMNWLMVSALLYSLYGWFDTAMSESAVFSQLSRLHLLLTKHFTVNQLNCVKLRFF